MPGPGLQGRPPSALPAAGDFGCLQMFGEVRLGTLIGRGAAGRVHRAYWMGSRVAVKVSITAAQRADHPMRHEEPLLPLRHTSRPSAWCALPLRPSLGVWHPSCMATPLLAPPTTPTLAPNARKAGAGVYA